MEKTTETAKQTGARKRTWLDFAMAASTATAICIIIAPNKVQEAKIRETSPVTSRYVVTSPYKVQEAIFRETILDATAAYLASGPGSCAALGRAREWSQPVELEGMSQGLQLVFLPSETAKCYRTRKPGEVFPAYFDVARIGLFGRHVPVGRVDGRELAGRALMSKRWRIWRTVQYGGASMTL